MVATKRHFEIVQQVNVAPENTLVLVGAALDGPSFVPFTLFEDSDPYHVLGDCALADAYLTAKRSGCDNIILFRINGSHAEAIIRKIEGTPQDVLRLRSVSASDDSNNVHVVVYPDHLFVRSTDGSQRTYFFDKYPTAWELAYAINLDAEYGLIEFTAEALDSQFPTNQITSTPIDVPLVGGSSDSNYVPDRSGSADMEWVVGLLKDKLKVALFGEDVQDQNDRMPSGYLETLRFGVIALVDMFHDDDPEFVDLLGSFCMNKTKVSGYGCLGVIGTKPLFEDGNTPLNDLVHSRVQDWIANGPPSPTPEHLNYVQVVIGDTDLYESNGRPVSASYAYAAAQASYPYHIMMTNKSIGIENLRYTIQKEDIETLNSNGYICIVPSVRRGFVPYRATSFSSESASVLSKPHHIRISQFISHSISEGLDNLIGGNVRFLKISDLNDWAKEMLDGFVNEGVIRDYTFRFELNSDVELEFYFTFTPYSEIQSVYTSTKIQVPQGAIR